MAKTLRKITQLLEPEFMAKLDTLDVLSRKIHHGRLQGERRSRRRGQSVEFADHRPYVVGDDLRFVDWNIYARLEQLFLKMFLEEQDLTVHIMVDVSGSVGSNISDQAADMDMREKYIKKLAAALGYVSMVNNNRVTMSTFANGVVGQLANMRGRNYLPEMAEFLLSATCSGASNFDSTCKQAVSGRIGSGIMIVLSDFMFKEGYEQGLRRLIGQKYDLYAIQVLTPDELEPKISGDLKLVDIEDSDTAEITVSSALLKYYKRNLSAYCNELKEFCTRRGGVYVLANASDAVETMVLKYLQRVSLLH
ncbi:MAG: DUF58 domain-containing protein [Phycisphaerae bacterium]|nr:DUF58 domain-containing protein [Phycisphaerae bacterium]